MLRLPGPTGVRGHDNWMHVYYKGVPLAGMRRDQVDAVGIHLAVSSALALVANPWCDAEGKRHRPWGVEVANAIAQGSIIDFETARRRYDPVYDGYLARPGLELRRVLAARPRLIAFDR